MSLSSDPGSASCDSCSCGYAAISSHPPGAAPARGPFLIQALCWHVNACLSRCSLGGSWKTLTPLPLSTSSAVRFSVFSLLQANPQVCHACFTERGFQTPPPHCVPALDTFQLPRAHSNGSLNTLADELHFSLRSGCSRRRQAVSHHLNASTGRTFFFFKGEEK